MTRINTRAPAPPTAPRTETPAAKPTGAPPKAGWTAPPTSGGPTTATGFDPAPAAPSPALKEIRTLLEGHTDRNEERRILDIFRGASPAELNQVLSQLPVHEVHELIGDLDDRWFGPDNRTAFLALLTRERLADLTPESRAKLVHGLQTGGTDGQAERAIRDIFLGTRGADLTALKNGIDSGVDYHDLQQLVFHDIDDRGIRGQLLAHFKAEAKPTGQVKVLSDIDDTFYENWVDDRFPKQTVYPGVRAFYQELDQGGGATADRLGDLNFLSARPYDRAGLTEGLTHDMLEKHGVTHATVLSGDLLHVIGNENIAAKKFDNWQQVRQLYPEYGSVFIGDSGQGDASFGAKAVATSPSDMKRVFIHNVTHLDAAQKADFAKQGVYVFDTYVGAATEAYRDGLITRDGLQRVADAAQAELAQVKFDSPEKQAARQAELDRDLAALRNL